MSVASRAAGSSLRAWPRRRTHIGMGLLLVVAVGLAACGQSGGSDRGSDGSSSASGVTDGSSGGTGGSNSATGGVPGVAMPTRVGDLDLEIAAYPVPEVLDAAGGAELSAMLRTLGLQPADVTLVIAVDPGGRLAIGRWQLPGRSAESILAAWRTAAGTGWRSDALDGEPALTGHGADGLLAWAVAREGVFLYVASEDRDLAAAAVAVTG